MYTNPEVESSYQNNNLGKTLYDWVIFLKPEVIIDFGVLNGYSAIAMAMACKENGKGKVKIYDIFEKYEYNHSNFEKLIKNIKEYGLLDYVEIEEVNFFDWIKEPEQFDMLHLDISNTADIIDLVWDNLKGNGEVLFEGGSEQRDRVGWMVVHNKKPINQTRARFEVVNSNFPSISRILWQKN
jgi:predicted O-methyltransferase YrrM